MTSLHHASPLPPSAETHEGGAEGEPPALGALRPPHIVRLRTESPLWKKDRLEKVRHAAEAALAFPTRHDTSASAAAAAADRTALVVSILCTDEQRMRALNRRFRGKDTACDSLAFPATTQNDGHHDEHTPHPQDQDQDDGMHGFLGDIALGYQGLQRTIERHRLDALAHCAHMTVHGVLHLKGFVHDTDEERTAMEEAEETILARLGFVGLHPLALP